MAQNVIIAGASYSDVTAVDIPKTGGGTARFVDTSGDTVTAAHLEYGYNAHGADGEPIAGELIKGIIPSGTKQITANGTGIDVTNYAAVDVSVPSKPEQSKTATANGTVYPDSGYVLSSVTVAIPYYEGW